MISDDLLYRPIGELAKMVRSRSLSPVELTEACLARIDSLDPTYHAFATVTRDLALRQAREAEREIAAGRLRGPLHGVPYAAKDLLATRGVRTTWGAKPYAERVPNDDAAVIRLRARSSGLLIAWVATGFDVLASRANVKGFFAGPTSDLVFYRGVTK